MSNPHHYAVVMAGGSGTRFWPLSRRDRPKQFLRILGARSLFAETLHRLRPIFPPGNIIIVTQERYKREAARPARSFGVPARNILAEPEGKNTAPAVCWAAAHLFKKDRQAIMAVLPSDHFIGNPAAFRRHLGAAFKLAAGQYLVTLGIVPTRPDTGYGYIISRPGREGRRTVWRVERFIEKPAAGRARQLLRRKGCFWNSGMFVWRADTILTEFATRLPVVYDAIIDRDERDVKRRWPGLPAISVDYGILEKAGDVVTVPAPDMNWSDVGSWQALSGVLTSDAGGNVLRGPVLARDCKDSLIVAGRRLVAGIGLEGIAVVETPDAVLVCRKDDSQKVREIVRELAKGGKSKYL